MSHILQKRVPKLPPLMTSTLSSAFRTFITTDSIAPVPEVVRKTHLLFSGASRKESISFSFSSIICENSGVLKYGTDSLVIFKTAGADITGPTVKFNISVILLLEDISAFLRRSTVRIMRQAAPDMQSNQAKQLLII